MSLNTVEPPRKQLKILLFADDQPGHMNAVIGMGQALLARGHRMLFLLNEAKTGQLAKYGFEEILLHNVNQEKSCLKNVAQILVSSANNNSDKKKEQTNSGWNFMEIMRETIFGYNWQIEEAIQRELPDLIVFDHFLVPPAFPRSNIPFVAVHSANPKRLYGFDKFPPRGADEQGKLNELCCYKPLDEDSNQKPSNRKSKYLTIYGYPEELDYDDTAPMPEKCARVDGFCRVDVKGEVFELPEKFSPKPGVKLIFVSLGSMASVNVELMKRITSVLASTPYKYIVSKGLRAEEYELPDNCWGKDYLPQIRILPLVDLVITHGGNNTIVETLTFGKPMIVLPLFADQHENAKRVAEKKYGIQLDTYNFTPKQMIEAIEQLLNDETVKQKAECASKRIQSSNSKELVCERIENLVYNFVK